MKKQKGRPTTESVMMACSTAKKTYENIFLKDKLMENTEYVKICAQLEDLKKRFPEISVSLFGS